ncbi:leucine-rich PPR motif-containing protein, mitochondrial [Epargyreus clarus]|uniref:leucine-rich PPR motif-containing protein, mitochondrial n=1 Tax=Epargyreus clarus TaxID=520877 RepID=UPI003C2C3A91
MSSLLRSTKFVRYFTGAARTLILNSAKTTEANSLINPKAVCAANSILLRDYATSKKKENLEPLLQRLNLEVKRYGRITKRDIDEVFDEIRGKNDITSSQSLLVIRCCGQLVPEELPEQRTLLVQKIWNILSERGVPMDISHYNALLRVYIENEHDFSPAAFLEELEKKGIEPNRVTYQRLMWRYCQDGDMDGALNVLEKMRELKMPVSEPVLNALVMGHSFLGDTEGAKVVMQTMSGAGLQPTNHTYALLACGYAKDGDLEGINSVISAAKDKDIYLTDKDLLEIVEHLAISGHEDKVDEIFQHLHKSSGYNQDVCNAIFRLLNNGCETAAKKVMKTMPKSGNINDTMFKGAFYVKHLLKGNPTPEKLIQQCRELQQENLVPSALYIATEVSLQMGHTKLAQALFKELQKDGFEIRQHYYWPLLVQKGKEKDEEGLLQLIRDMNNEGIMLTGEALRDYVIPYIMDKESPQNVIVKLQIANIPAIHSARNLMVELLEAGEIKKGANIALQYQPRGQYNLVARPLLIALNKSKDVESFATILHVISSNPTIAQTDEEGSKDDSQIDDKGDTNEIGRIVVLGVKNLNNPDLCKNLLDAVLAKGLRISTSRAEEIEHFLSNNMTPEISDILSKLTSADLERAPVETVQRRVPRQLRSNDLEKMLEKSRRSGDANINSLQKQLFLAYLKENNVAKLEPYLEELKASNFELTTAALAQLFEFYCENDLISKANEVKALLLNKEPEFVFNRYKCILMAYALLRANKYDEALQFFIDNKQSNEITTSNFLVNSKSWQMLNYLAEQKEDAKVRELTKALIENNYVEPSNILLGPSIKAHIVKDDIEGALNEFEYCCKQYRCTPWKGELMKALIMKEDAGKLQWLADLSTQIHGEVNILHDLVLAFVECGRLRQARRILETPGLHTRQKRLQDACERYVEEGKSEYLEGLLEATKELSHIDRSKIYYHLLVTYCTANETDKALGLWTILQEEGEIPSEKFLVYLGEHLKANNREVPFAIPGVAKPVQVENKSEKSIVKQQLTKPQKSEITVQIEDLVKQGNAPKALDLAIKSIQEGVMPKSNVLKFTLKNLAEEGNVEKIQALGQYLSDKTRREVTYDDKLTLAIFKRGAGSQHIDSLITLVKAVDTNEDLEVALRKFPRSNSLEMAVQDKDLAKKCYEVAEIAASRGHSLPANLLWMEYLLQGMDNEANALWNTCLSNASVIVFRRLLQESHTQKKPELIEKLISILHTNKSLSPASLGNAYSRLINYHISDNHVDKAQEVLKEAMQKGISKEHFNKNTLQRLLEASKAAGKSIEFTI